jgi:hypothetical protein
MWVVVICNIIHLVSNNLIYIFLLQTGQARAGRQSQIKRSKD